MPTTAETVRDSLLSHRPDPAYCEDLWAEVERALGEADGLRLTVDQLVQRAAEKRATLAKAVA